MKKFYHFSLYLISTTITLQLLLGSENLTRLFQSEKCLEHFVEQFIKPQKIKTLKIFGPRTWCMNPPFSY